MAYEAKEGGERCPFTLARVALKLLEVRSSARPP